MASARGSYVVRPWVLYQSADPLRAARAQAGVDAVIVETPYERVRFQSFLEAMQGTPLRGTAVAHLQRTASRRIGFVVYSHSRNGEDRDFLGKIGHASINSGGRSISAVDVERFGPASDFYSVGDFREIRWTGSATFRFPVNPECASRGTLHFTDAYGHAYAFIFNLAKFR